MVWEQEDQEEDDEAYSLLIEEKKGEDVKMKMNQTLPNQMMHNEEIIEVNDT